MVVLLLLVLLPLLLLLLLLLWLLPGHVAGVGLAGAEDDDEDEEDDDECRDGCRRDAATRALSAACGTWYGIHFVTKF